MAKQDLMKLAIKEQIVMIGDEKIIVKELTAGQASAYQHSLYKIVKGKPEVKAEGAEIKLVILCSYNEDGSKYFDMADMELVKNLPGWVVEKLYNVANKLNNPSKEELEKN